ncbi:hypothetical protein [Rhodococcus sp. 14-2470-1b]|uniref:hypothetical protein n=1 Tax=Rhodococcus sp. 14-2470-1b TaxID=2023149 RepID=UPI001595BBC8|nr:hypothetical protein [Rhodococcus sp. 14-2470-1b]
MSINPATVNVDKALRALGLTPDQWDGITSDLRAYRTTSVIENPSVLVTVTEYSDGSEEVDVYVEDREPEDGNWANRLRALAKDAEAAADLVEGLQ